MVGLKIKAKAQYVKVKGKAYRVHTTKGKLSASDQKHLQGYAKQLGEGNLNRRHILKYVCQFGFEDNTVEMLEEIKG